MPGHQAASRATTGLAEVQPPPIPDAATGAAADAVGEAQFDERDLIALIPQTRAFARRICRNATLAEDLTQDALSAAWRNRGAFKRGTNLRAWVFVILRNRFYSDQRRAWRTLPLDPKLAPDTPAGPPSPDGALELDEVRRAMMALPGEQRDALALVAVAGLTYDKAATICCCAVGTVKSRVSQARRSLLAALAEGDMPAERHAPCEAMAWILSDAQRAQDHPFPPRRLA